jgi:UDP-glucose 4-epimerase
LRQAAPIGASFCNRVGIGTQIQFNIERLISKIVNPGCLPPNTVISGGESCALNLANARGYSVREVITGAERACGRTIAVTTTARRPGDPPVLVGAAGRARAALSWSPARSDLDVQITDAWDWFKSRSSGH